MWADKWVHERLDPSQFCEIPVPEIRQWDKTFDIHNDGALHIFGKMLILWFELVYGIGDSFWPGEIFLNQTIIERELLLVLVSNFPHVREVFLVRLADTSDILEQHWLFTFVSVGIFG